MYNLKLTGIIGLIGSILVGIGEFMLHYNANGYNGDNYAFFVSILEWRLIVGHFMVVFFVPLYIIGYWHIFLRLNAGNKGLAQAVLILGIFAFVLGGMWISSRGLLGFIAKSIHAGDTSISLLAHYRLLMETLVQVLRLIIILISALFIIAIRKGGTLYPSWMTWFNPGLALGMVFMLYFIFPLLGNILAPTAMNIAHIVVFSASLFSLNTKPSLK